MRSSAFLLFLVAAIVAGCAAFAGCGDNSVGPIGQVDLPFDLTIPANRPAGDIYAVSGILTRTNTVRVGDSIVETSFPSFYAQFSAPGGALPAKVLLNGSELERNKGGDTLRLDEATASVFGNNIWKLVDEGGAADSFTVQTVDVLDSIGPFRLKKTFRSDTDLQIGWMPPRLASSGLTMIWRSPDSTMAIPLADIGFYTISKADLKRLRGRGTVTFVRYLNIQKSYKGRKVILTRLAEHRYEVTVE